VCTRTIILDLVVNRAWRDWLDGCKAAGVVLPVENQLPDLVRIDADAWGAILPPPRDAADYPGARAAVLCAALCGAEHARQNRLPPTTDQQQARRGMVDQVRELLPRPDDLCYLPTQEEMQWLDLPLWSTGVVDLAALREATSRQLAASQLRDLVPHWLEQVM